MSIVGQPERATQNRVVALFRNELAYRYLGDWADRDGNSNIEEGLLAAWLTRSGTTPAQIRPQPATRFHSWKGGDFVEIERVTLPLHVVPGCRFIAHKLNPSRKSIPQ